MTKNESAGLLIKRTHLKTIIVGQTNDLVDYAVAAYGFLIRRGETLTGAQLAERIGQVYDCSSPRHQAVQAALCQA